MSESVPKQTRRIFALHCAAMALLGVHVGVLGIMPVLLRKTFDAGEWQTNFATMAIPAMAVLTLFWNEVYARIDARKFLVGLWLTNHVPLAAISFCEQASTVLVFYVASTVTYCGVNLFYADVLRTCYPAGIRNRLFAVLNSIGLLCTIGSAYAVGTWLDIHPEAFRIYLPITVLLAGLGIILLRRIAATPEFRDRHVHAPTQPLLVSLTRVAHNVVNVFRENRSFRRCEGAFFIYGLGYMFCSALLPFLVCDKLNLKYAEVARSTQVSYNVILLFTFLIGGYLMDRLGAVRVTTWSLILVILYPVGLTQVVGEASLTAVVVYNAIAMTGVQLAGTMVPLELAPNPAHAPMYVGIHSALVGPRAIIGHVAAVAIYDFTGRIEIPLLIAACLYAGGAVFMIRLERDYRVIRATAKTEPPISIPLSEPTE